MKLKKRSRRSTPTVWSLFFFWVGVVVGLVLLGLMVKGGLYGWYLWRWYDEPRVNIVSFDPERVVVFSFDKKKKLVWIYVIKGEIKWPNQMGKESQSLLDWQSRWGNGGLGLKKMADLIEFNLAVPVKGLIWQKQGHRCNLEAIQCLKSSYWPVGLKGRVEGSMSIWHRWFGRWLMNSYDVKVKELRFKGEEFGGEEWDKVWRKGMEGEVIDVAILAVVKSRSLKQWYERMITNLGWRVVQTEWVKRDWFKKVSNLKLDDYNYCLWQGRKSVRYKDTQMALFLRCEVSDKIKIVKARADLAIIINQFIW